MFWNNSEQNNHQAYSTKETNEKRVTRETQKTLFFHRKFKKSRLGAKKSVVS